MTSLSQMHGILSSFALVTLLDSSVTTQGKKEAKWDFYFMYENLEVENSQFEIWKQVLTNQAYLPLSK